MKFALLAAHQYRPGDDMATRLSELWEMTAAAEEAGYAGVFAIQHFVGNLMTPQTISVVGRLVEVTRTMTVGTSILILPAHHPVHIAEEFATLDHLSGGRVILGVGAGYRRNEFRALNVDKNERFARLGEGVQVIRKLWTGEPVYHEGRFYRLEGDRIGVPPLTPGGPPIWMGGGGDVSIRRAARLADSWIAPGNSPTPGWFERAMGIHDEALAVEAAVSRPDRVHPVIVNLFCAATDAEAERLARPFVQAEYDAYSEYPQLAFQHEKFQFLWDERFLIGSPDTVSTKIARLQAIGFDYLIARMSWIGTPVQDVLTSLDLIRREVMPRFVPTDAERGATIESGGAPG